MASIGAAMLGVSGGMGYFGMFSAALGGIFLIMFGILAVIEFVIAGALFSGKPWGKNHHHRTFHNRLDNGPSVNNRKSIFYIEHNL